MMVTAEQFHQRVIQPDAFVADTEAFLDVRIPRSKGKASYSMIGPGVSQNPGQTINLAEPHGFNIGAASMPSGVVNNQHLHYTAEVFFCTRGSWDFHIGEARQQTLPIVAGDIFVTPTWVFRGFTNTGGDDGWVFTVLGGDDTGGILWAPDVLREAAETGLYLTPDNTVIESLDGPPASYIRPLDADSIAAVDCYTDEQLAAQRLRLADRQWSSQATLASVLPGHGVEIAPVLGAGTSQDRHQQAPIGGTYGFSLEWYRCEPGQRTGLHRIDDSQVLFLYEGQWEVAVNSGPQQLSARPEPNSVVSIPQGAWRDFRSVGDQPATAVVVSGGDHPNLIQWDSEIVTQSAAAGWGIDASGKLAPANLIGGVS